MGIKDFYKVFADGIVTIPGLPKDKLFAVDAAGEIWRAGVMTQSNLSDYESILYSVCSRMKRGSIWVFDRTNVHKTHEHEIRKERRRVAEERKDKIQDVLDVHTDGLLQDALSVSLVEDLNEINLNADEYIESNQFHIENGIVNSIFHEEETGVPSSPEEELLAEDVIVKKIESLEKQTFRPNSEHFRRARRIIQDCGHMAITAPIDMEAEAYCAYLNKTGQVDYVFTIDSDVFAFGAVSVIRRTQKQVFQCLTMDDILKQMPEGYQTYSDFIDLCVCLGCDFCPRIRGVGQKTCMKVTKTRDSLPLWVFSKRKWTEAHHKAKAIFQENIPTSLPTDE